MNPKDIPTPVTIALEEKHLADSIRILSGDLEEIPSFGVFAARQKKEMSAISRSFEGALYVAIQEINKLPNGDEIVKKINEAKEAILNQQTEGAKNE